MAEIVSGGDPAPEVPGVSHDVICLRCDWTGETASETCPRCEAPVYRLWGSTKPSEVDPSGPQQTSTDDLAPSSTADVHQEDDSAPPAVRLIVGRRKWLIVGGLTVAAVWIVATGGPFDRQQPSIVSATSSGAGTPSASGAASPSAAGGRTEPRVHVIGDITSAPARSPDGNRIVFGARGGTLYLMDLRSDRRSVIVRLPGENLDSVDEIEWSPDSAHLAVMNDLEPGGGRLYIMNADGSGIRVVLDDYESAGLAWSPDGQVLAYATDGGDRPDRLWTVSSAKGRPFTVVTSGRISDPVWSPDGSHIAFVGSRRGGRAWYAVDAYGAGSPLQIDELTYQNWRGQNQN